MEELIVNRVAQSGIETFMIENYYPSGERVEYDLAQHLFEGLILKEKEFRNDLKNKDWTVFSKKHVALFCSAEAIIPMWAYMLLSIYLFPYAETLIVGNREELEKELYIKELEKINWTIYQDKIVMIKGCSHRKVPQAAYVKSIEKLKPLVKSLFFGEPCSAVPLFKRAIS